MSLFEQANEAFGTFFDASEEENASSSEALFGDSIESSNEEGAENANKDEYKTIARRETAVVHKLRILLVFILMTIVGISVAGILFLRNSSRKQFEQEFIAQGDKVVDGFRSGAATKLQAMEALSTSLTSYALDSNLTWPFVTVQNSGHFFEPYATLVSAASIAMMPVVGARQRVQWEEYSVAHQGWIDKDITLRSMHGLTNGASNETSSEFDDSISPFIKNYVGIDVSPGPWIAWWQYTPVIDSRWFVNFNRLAYEKNSAQQMEAALGGKAAISKTLSFVPGLDFQSTHDFSFTNDLLVAGGNGKYEPGEPIGYIYYPVFQDYETNKSKVVAVLMMTVYWKTYFQGILSDTTKGIVCVVENNLGQVFTYRIDGEHATFLGMEDLHEKNYDGMVIEAADNVALGLRIHGGTYSGVPLDESTVSYKIKVYPSADLKQVYVNDWPIIFTSIMMFIFAVTVVVFIAYDCYVQKRQNIVMNTAVRSGAVLGSIFPKNVKERLMEEATLPVAGKTRLKRFLSRRSDDEQESSKKDTKPIADLFPEVTVMLCDLVGFTSWSSTRQPEQVFVLLESLFHEFDEIAKRRRVYKACGLPDPRKDHALVMARFARDCHKKLGSVTRKLEAKLGPDTSDLSMRFGLHSGPVTAGVLRGDKSRFQLFGDTINTASRMESTGEPGKIHLSEETAARIIAAGKPEWLVKRDTRVAVKGKGEMQTYWLNIGSDSSATMHSPASTRSSEDSVHNIGIEDVNPVDKKTASLICYNVDTLAKLLRQIIARRQERNCRKQEGQGFSWTTPLAREGCMVLDEVKEIISLPNYEPVSEKVSPDSVVLSSNVEHQLSLFVKKVAIMYRYNPFHNFYHATHVTLSVEKLLSRIVAPSNLGEKRLSSKSLHDYTYGITSDPLTQFSCVLTALIHDIDHHGVPNSQLVKEEAPVAKVYKNKSVAEQNSVNLAWNLLMSDTYTDLRAAIAGSTSEVERFKQLVTNLVLATDIMDKDLKVLRNARWDKAFSDPKDITFDSSESLADATSRKATIVLEHLIQASDVAHTMQHWHVYIKFNQRLFRELRKAYMQGRSETDPAFNWYQGELGFFDFYVIPLAKKLKDCGVFGVSSDEYLQYATSNREEWFQKGQSIVESFIEAFDAEWNAEQKAKSAEDEENKPHLATGDSQVSRISI